MKKITDLQKLALDCYYGNVTKYSQAEGEEILRNKMIDILGEMPENPAKFRRKFNAVSGEFFELVEEIMTVTLNRLSEEAFGDFVNFKNYEIGQKGEIRVDSTELYKVSKIATGLTTVRSQKIYNGKMAIETFRLAVKAHEEFFDFISNKISWAKTVDRVVASFHQEFANVIANAVFSAYDIAHTNLKESTNAPDEPLKKMIAKVKGATGKNVAVYGTPSALDKIEGASAELDKEDRREFGHVKRFNGVDCIQLPQAYNVDTNEFVGAEDVLIVCPVGEKFVAAGYEGDAMVIENIDPAARRDMLMEFEYLRMAYVGVAQSKIFGAIKITN